jgi:hypothetical protein
MLNAGARGSRSSNRCYGAILSLGIGIRRTLERRIRAWRAIHATSRRSTSARPTNPGQAGLSDFIDMGEIIIGRPLTS